MQIDFDKRYPVDATTEQAWAVLADVRATAACWPGAVLSAQIDARRYQGTIGVEVGAEPVRLDGDLELLGMDAARRELRMRAQGREALGSSLSAELLARVDEADVPGTGTLVMRGSIGLEGRLAQLDRRTLVTAADRLLARFADNFRAAAAAAPSPAGWKGRQPGGPSRGSGMDSTLTLMVQAGQAPGAAFAAKNEGPTDGEPTRAPGAWGQLRRWLAGWVSRREA